MASTRALRPTLGNLLTQCSSRPTTTSPSSAALRLLRQQPATVQISRPFSTTSSAPKRHTYIGARKTRDANPRRGESTVRRTGTRFRLSVSDDPLPKPVRSENIPLIETDPNHGMYGFFYEKDRIVLAPSEMADHGRSWTVNELRSKSWEDLHKLWWVCVRERNRVAALTWERRKAQLGFGLAEDQGRGKTAHKTQGAIKAVLTERYYAWEDAYKLAESDPEINLQGGGENGPVYTPANYFEEAEVDEAVAEKAEGAEERPDITEEKKAEVTESGEVKLIVDPATLPDVPSAGEGKEAYPKV